MNDILSQEEIDALLRGEVGDNQTQQDVLTSEEKDALGEIGNISMGTAATTLFTLLNHKVTITTPEVEVTNLKELAAKYPIPFVAVEVGYTQGFEGRNLLIVKEEDVKIITDLMMGGDGSNIDNDLTDIHLSAIGEVMNQMIGSSSTSLATMFKKNINISPPKVSLINLADEDSCELFKSDEPIVKVNFKMEITDILDSYMIQLIPVDFAKKMVQDLMETQGLGNNQETSEKNSQPIGPAQTIGVGIDSISEGDKDMFVPPVDNRQSESVQFYSDVKDTQETSRTKPIDVRPVHFEPLEDVEPQRDKSNIDLILDVPLEVSVELGTTKKTIKEILELNSGSIIELNKMAGEPVDILVNGKMIAKGEVVVIDDNFGVRITDIINPIKRITQLK